MADCEKTYYRTLSAAAEAVQALQLDARESPLIAELERQWKELQQQPAANSDSVADEIYAAQVKKLEQVQQVAALFVAAARPAEEQTVRPLAESVAAAQEAALVAQKAAEMATRALAALQQTRQPQPQEQAAKPREAEASPDVAEYTLTEMSRTLAEAEPPPDPENPSEAQNLPKQPKDPQT